MTPCINTVKKANIFFKIHEYTHDSSVKSYGLEAVTKLNIKEERVFKTLIVNIGDKELITCVIPVSSQLNMKLVSKAMGVKKASMAEKSDVEKSTGYILGGVSPIGQKKRLKTIIDSSAKQHKSIFISAGRRGLEIEVKPQDLQKVINGTFSEICC